jgi:hypothetical protein
MLGIIDSTLDIPFDGLQVFWDAGQFRSLISGSRTIFNLSERDNYTGSFISGSGGLFPFYTSSGGGSINFPVTVFPAAGVVGSQVTGSLSAGTIIVFASRIGAQFADAPFMFTDNLRVEYFAASNVPQLTFAFGLFRDSSIGFMSSSVYYMVGGSGAANSQKLYLNKTVSNFTSSRSVPVTYTRATVGAANVGSGTSFRGNIAIALFYNRQLSDTEVFQIYDFFKPRFPDLP